MEHNTLVKYGFKKGVEQPVFDPETEAHLAPQYESLHPKFDLAESKPNSPQVKK
jgi:hypothetical protein